MDTFQLFSNDSNLFPYSWHSEIRDFQVLTHDLYAVTLTETFTISKALKM